ncbi:tubby-related protein 2 isoform X3 [Fukomys damarensis]|uniref:tubby-related protein 2 isoform X3 n=1 Tax=Fukomys damarensis TaxID=885580 RepID=UPI00053F8730|nr:tubby-related protein 2 isoform X3 [Fukomys damarensis]
MTAMEEPTALRLQKLEQQRRRLFEKKQRRKREEPLMVQANRYASLWHGRLQSEHFASDRGSALHEHMPDAHPDSRFHSPLDATINCDGDGTRDCWALGWPTQAEGDGYDQSEAQDVEDEYEWFGWGSACGMDGDGRRHGDLIFCKNIDPEEQSEESHSVGINSQAVDNEAVPWALEDEGSRDVGSVANSSPLAPGPQPGEDLKAYMLRPPQEGHKLQCFIRRDQRGMEKGLFPVYYLYLEAADSWKVRSRSKSSSTAQDKHFLLAGRKRKWSKTSNYLISLDPMDLSRDGDNFVGKVRSNTLGTKFVIFDDGVNPEDENSHLDKTQIRQELGAVCYKPNVWGARGPRKMTVIIPEINSHNQRIRVQPETEEESLLSRFQRGARQGLVLLQNKPPVWSDESDTFVLNFHGRVTQASVKNFQIIYPNKPDKVVLQFGRVAPDIFTMDFCFPLCPLQAFAICLTSFDGKLACA